MSALLAEESALRFSHTENESDMPSKTGTLYVYTLLAEESALRFSHTENESDMPSKTGTLYVYTPPPPEIILFSSTKAL